MTKRVFIYGLTDPNNPGAPGAIVPDVPDDVSVPAFIDDLTSRGIISPEDGAASLVWRGYPDVAQQRPPEPSTATEVTRGMGRTLSRWGGLPADQPMTTTAGKIGERLPPIAAHLATPGRAIPQAMVGGAVGYLDTGDPEEALYRGGTAGLATGLMNVASRTATGAARIEANAFRNRQLGQFQPTMPNATTAIGRSINKSVKNMGFTGKPLALNQEVTTRMMARSLGLGDDVTRITPDKFRQAGRFVSQRYKDATVNLQPVPTAPLKQQWLAIRKSLPNNVSSKIDKVMRQDTMSREQFVKLDRILRDQIPAMRRSASADIVNAADDVQGMRDALWSQGSKLGADQAILADANTRFKLLQIAKEQGPSVRTGEVDIGRLADQFAKDRRTGFGDDYIEQALDSYAPDVAGLLRMTRLIASNPNAYGQAGTAATLLAQTTAMGGGGAAVGAVATGGNPVGAIGGTAAGLSIPWLAGRAGYGWSPDVLGRVYGAAGGESATESRDRLREWLGR